MTGKDRVIMLLFLTSACASGQGSTDPKQISEMSKEFKCKDPGQLAVFGTLLDPGSKKGVYGASVKLFINRVAVPVEAYTSQDGKYCITYPSGPSISTLWFEKDGVSCVEQLSGDRSHYINKVFDKNCSGPLRHSIAAVSLSEAKLMFGSYVSKHYIPIVVVFRNLSGQDIQVLSVHFRQVISGSGSPASALEVSGAAGNSRDAVVPIPSELVFLGATRRPAFTLLRIGPIALATTVQPESQLVRLQDLSLRSGEMIPPNSSKVKVIFVPRAKLPAVAYHSQANFDKAFRALGDLVVEARGLVDGGKIASFSSSEFF